MKYTTYFAQLFKAQGVPQIGVDQLNKVMNMVHLEGQIKALESVKKDSAKPRNHTLKVFRIQRKLTDITQNTTPEKFMELLVSGLV